MTGLGIIIHFISPFVISGITCNISQLGKNRHSHLHGINPVPIIDLIGNHHRIDRGFDVDDIPLGFLGVELIKIEISLTGTLIVGITGLPPVFSSAKFPIMLVSPFQCIVEITLLRVDFPQIDKPLVIIGTSPYVGFIIAFTRRIGNRLSGIAPLLHKIIVGQTKRFQDIFFFGLSGRWCFPTTGKQHHSQEKDR